MKRKILIIRFSSIGDIVLTTPVIRCLKLQSENIEIHFLVKKNFASIVSSNPFVDKVIEYDNNTSATIEILKTEGYSEIIDLQNNFRSFKMKRALAIKARSFHKLNFEKWIYVNFKINRLPSLHIVDRYLDTVSDIGIKNDGLGLQYFIPHEYEVNVQTLTSGSFKDYIALVIGAAHQTKKMPLHLWKELIAGFEIPFIVLGGKEDMVNGEALSELAPHRSYNACGKFNLHQSASLVKQASVVVTHDTGLMHIAAAFKKPIISIWGNTVPQFGMYPYYGNQAVEQIMFQNNQLSCRPCSKIGHATCPKDHFRCMEDQNVTEIISGIKYLFHSFGSSNII